MQPFSPPRRLNKVWIMTRAQMFAPCLAVAMLAWPAATEEASYLSDSQIELASILPPPPPPDSLAAQEDFAAVLAAQDARTPEESALAIADFDISVFRFASGLGKDFSKDKLPLTAALFRQVLLDSLAPIVVAKEHFARPRPPQHSADVKPILDFSSNDSYPSGHATVAHLYATLLARMFPEKSHELFARADQYAYNRVVAGVHYPSDVHAGQIAAAVIASNLLRDSRFLADLDRATEEARQFALPFDAQ